MYFQPFNYQPAITYKGFYCPGCGKACYRGSKIVAHTNKRFYLCMTCFERAYNQWSQQVCEEALLKRNMIRVNKKTAMQISGASSITR